MTWEYKWLTSQTAALNEMAVKLNALGSVGWEVCGFAAADKTIGLNEYAVLLKRSRLGLAPPSDSSAGWRVDPTGRFDQRYWDGLRWTEHVTSSGTTDVDPPIPATPVAV